MLTGHVELREVHSPKVPEIWTGARLSGRSSMYNMLSVFSLSNFAWDVHIPAMDQAQN